ncbi:MAG: two-component system response regulator GlrR [Desulfobulbaceae bacterium DB1]|nr:MAG: two-component system response regulator GlrR [Desulfobulbaceae bacterium DB1]
MSIKPRILLVDDDTDLLSLFSIRLQSQGFDVMTAESGEQALSRIPILNPHLLITDLRMGEMDGLALFEAVHKINSSLPVIVITAHGSIPEAVEATQKGVFSFLTKPVDSHKLLQEINAALTIAGNPTEENEDEKNNDWCREIIYKSSAMANLMHKAKLVAQSDAGVLILGESGTGKELLANAIHRASARAAGPFVPVNCAAIPEALLESELFGHAKGSFTGAATNYAGLFKTADTGTLFLDEIGDMPLSLQVKLLRVLQEKQVRSIGSPTAVDVDVRIISATHRKIEEEVRGKTFREDLFYRLNVVSLEIPPLHTRREDIPLLAHYFIKKLTTQNNREISGFSPAAMKLLMEAPWPGNVRQLQNVIEQTVALSPTPLISESLLADALKDKPMKIVPFADARRQFEQEYLVHLLQATRGNVTEAARQAKRNRTDFYKLLNRHHIVPSLFKD